ncbi:MAG: sulfatase [Opitutaceae bacterium]|nr:sulfatase [Opitutaceae bacterium]
MLCRPFALSLLVRPRAAWFLRVASTILAGVGAVSLSGATLRQPNFIVILADDLGYADLACYGNTRVATPHLDRLAAEGVRFTDFHANGPMCSPTRAALLTGRYPQRVGIETALPLMAFPAKREGLPAGTVTVAKRLAEAGYATGLFGKWHLGHHPDENPVRFGFAEFRGLLCGDGDFAAQISRNGLPDWWDNETLRPEPAAKNTTAAITDHAIGFLERHREKPFFLYVAHLAIHFPWMRPDDPAHRRLGTRYPGVADPANSKLGPHVGSAQMQEVVHAMIADLDHEVGRLVAALHKLGLDENTLVVFTSDNGGYVHYEGLHRGEISDNGPFRDGKTSVYEGGHRVPAIARWPGRIAAGTVSPATTATFDLAPTFLALAGVAAESPAAFDGIDLSAHLLRGAPLPERPIFWRIRGARAVRSGDWKLVAPRAAAGELYHLTDDPGESRNLAATEPERVATLTAALAAWEADVRR